MSSSVSSSSSGSKREYPFDQDERSSADIKREKLQDNLPPCAENVKAVAAVKVLISRTEQTYPHAALSRLGIRGLVSTAATCLGLSHVFSSDPTVHKMRLKAHFMHLLFNARDVIKQVPVSKFPQDLIYITCQLQSLLGDISGAKTIAESCNWHEDEDWSLELFLHLGVAQIESGDLKGADETFSYIKTKLPDEVEAEAASEGSRERELSKPENLAKRLSKYVANQAKNGDIETARRTAAKILFISNSTLILPKFKGGTSCAIIKALLKIGDFDGAKVELGLIEDPSYKDKALVAFVEAYLRNNAYIDVTVMFDLINDLSLRITTGTKIASHQMIKLDVKSAWDHFFHVKKLVMDLDGPEERKVKFLSHIGTEQAKSGDITGAVATFKEARELAGEPRSLRSSIAIAQLDAGDLSGALETAVDANRFLTTYDREITDSIYDHLSIARAKAGDYSGAFNAILKTTCKTIRTDAPSGWITEEHHPPKIQKIILLQAQAGHIADAKQNSTIQLPDTLDRAYALLLIAREQAKNGDQAGGMETLNQAKFEWEKVITEPMFRDAREERVKRLNCEPMFYSTMAEAQAMMGDIKGAKETAELKRCVVVNVDNICYSKIAETQARNGDDCGAEETANLIRDPQVKAYALTQIGSTLLSKILVKESDLHWVSTIQKALSKILEELVSEWLNPDLK